MEGSGKRWKEGGRKGKGKRGNAIEGKGGEKGGKEEGKFASS